MENVKKWMSQRRAAEEHENQSSRIPAIIGLILTAIFTGIFIYVASTYFGNLRNPEVSAPVIVSERPPNRLLSPNVYVCTTETRPRLIWSRAKRQTPTLIKRVARPLSPAPPIFSVNGTYDPPLYHDAGAKCAWGRLTARRVPDIENVGISYDSQQLGARSCDDPEICKSICLRMHKSDDPYLCNYFTWNREKKVALFYFLEPTIRWNLTQDLRVETFFWQCRATQCTWFWRPRRIHPSFADLTATQLRSAHGLLSVSQCTDFASCQFACETRPSFRELQEQGQVLPADINLDDPTCDYVVMPSADTKNSFSFLFSMRQHVLKNTTYASSQVYDSFELICKDKPKAGSVSSTIAAAVPPALLPAKVQQGQGQPVTVVAAAPPPQPAPTPVATASVQPATIETASQTAQQAVIRVAVPPQQPPPQPQPTPVASAPLGQPVTVPVAAQPKTALAETTIPAANQSQIPSQGTAVPLVTLAAQNLSLSAAVVPQGIVPTVAEPALGQPVNPGSAPPAQAATVRAAVPPPSSAEAAAIPDRPPAAAKVATVPAAAQPTDQSIQSATVPAVAPVQEATVPVVTLLAAAAIAQPAHPVPVTESQPIQPAPLAIPSVAQLAAINEAFPVQAAPVAPQIAEPAPPVSEENAAPPAQPSIIFLTEGRRRRREVPQEMLNDLVQDQAVSDTVHLRECKQGGKVIDCSKLTKDAKSDAPCIQLTTEPGHEHLSISISTKKPVWFSVEQPSLDGMEEHISLLPGRQHVIDMRLEKGESDTSKCGPLSVRGRRCAATCNDRIAVDTCGCSLNTDPDAGYMGSMVSVPLCNDHQLKSCVLDQLRSDGFFDCMNECKKECSTWRPFEFHNTKGSKLASDDYLVLDLRFPRAESDVQAEPMWWNKSIEQVLQIWAPALMVLMLLLAVVAVIYVSTRR